MKVDGIVSSPNPLVMTNNLLWKMAIDIVDLPIKNGGFPMLNYQRVQYGWKIWKSGVLMGCKWSDVPLPLITPVILVIFMGKNGNMILTKGWQSEIFECIVSVCVSCVLWYLCEMLWCVQICLYHGSWAKCTACNAKWKWQWHRTYALVFLNHTKTSLWAYGRLRTGKHGFPRQSRPKTDSAAEDWESHGSPVPPAIQGAVGTHAGLYQT